MPYLLTKCVSLANLQNSTCETTLSFADTNFPPSHAIAQPRACAAEQLISFAIPQAAPDGLAELQWSVLQTDEADPH